MRHPGLGRPAAILATVLATMLTILAVNTSTASATERPVVQEGDQGPAVQTVQHLLHHSGSDIEADGTSDGAASLLRTSGSSRALRVTWICAKPRQRWTPGRP